MGCFPAFFTCAASKRRKSTPSKELQAGREENLLIKLIRESKEEVEVQVKCGARKRVTFDLSVKDNNEPLAGLLGNTDDEKKSRKENEEEEEEEKRKTAGPPFDTNALCITLSSAPNNRYQDCRKSTDECEDVGLEISDFEVEEGDDSDADDERILREESSESLFSLSIDSRKQASEVEKGEKEVNSPMPKEERVKAIGSCLDTGKRHRFGDSVLSPIENSTRIKERHVLQCLKREDKKNISLEEPSLKREFYSSKLKLVDVSPKPARQEIGVDTSLSSWLIGYPSVSKSNDGDHSVGNSEFDKENSPRCPKKEKILGDLRIKELKQCRGLSSSTRSRSQSTDVTVPPMIGTVGSFWVHTGREMDSDSSPLSGGGPITPSGKKSGILNLSS